MRRVKREKLLKTRNENNTIISKWDMEAVIREFRVQPVLIEIDKTIEIDVIFMKVKKWMIFRNKRIDSCIEYINNHKMITSTMNFIKLSSSVISQFCGDCGHLSISEFHQDMYGLQNIPHRCNKYKVIIKHKDHHPELPRILQCFIDGEREKLEGFRK